MNKSRRRSFLDTCKKLMFIVLLFDEGKVASSKVNVSRLRFIPVIR